MRGTITALGLQALSLTPALADRVVPSWIDVLNPGNNPAQQIGRAVATDPRGNVAICGYLDDGVNTETFFVAKYDGLHGNLMWLYKIPSNQTSASRALSVATDSQGNVIATGWYDTNNGHDYYTIKLGSTAGNVIWFKTYNNTASNGLDEAALVAVDSDDNVVVTGKSVNSGTQEDIYTIRYLANGTVDWAYRYNSPENRRDFPEALALDSEGNVIIGGTADANGDVSFYTAKIARESADAIGDPVWEKLSPSAKYGVTGLAVDPDDNIIVTGLKQHAPSVDTDLVTIKYSKTNGNALWSKSYYTEDPSNINLTTEIGRNYWAGVSVDSKGDVFVATTSSAGTPAGEVQKRRIYLAKYDGITGDLLWNEYSVPEKKGAQVGTGDIATGIITDGASNTIVIGTSDSPFDEYQLEYYIARYRSEGGEPTAVYRFNGDQSGGTDVPAAITLDRNKSAVITGYSRKPADPSNNAIRPGAATIKLTRLLAVTGDPVSADGLSSKAKLGTLFTPAIADTGSVVARVTIVNGKKKLGGIFESLPDGTSHIRAVQGADAPGIDNAKFKSFYDPVISESGTFAFLAKLSGKGVPKTAVYRRVLFFGATIVQPVLQQGKPLGESGQLSELSVKSISGISSRGNYILALVTLTGVDVNKTNNRALIAIDAAGTASVLLRTGAQITVNGEDSEIKTISVLANTKGATGHGRSQASQRTAARLGLKDGRSVVVLVNHATAAITQGPATGGAATALAGTGTWKALSIPSIGDSQTVAVLGTATGDGISKNTDTGIVYTTNGTTYAKLAREGDTTPTIPDVAQSKFTGFSDPVVGTNNSVAFLASISGSGVNKKNSNTLWVGLLSPFIQPVCIARQGDRATDTAGFEGTAKWSSFLSLAVPGGEDRSPIFTAKVAGKKNNLGLWGICSDYTLRQLIRTGDVLDLATGDTVKGFTLLQASPGSTGATRSFNNQAGVVLLLKLKKGQAIYAMAIP